MCVFNACTINSQSFVTIALRIHTINRIIQSGSKYYVEYISTTGCRPSKGRRCIPDVILKNEGSMVQSCRNINVHVVNTDIY